ncbi:MAG: hypothetical protein ACOYUZ_00710 [Patescibacteria group bacterium]
MPEIISSRQIENARQMKLEPLTDIRAQIVSIGGTIVLALTIVVTMVLAMSYLMPNGNGLQFLIILLLNLITWGFFLNCATERLSIKDNVLEYSSILSRAYRFDLEDIVAYKVSDLGLQFNGDKFLFTVELIDKDKPVEIGLGPCWKKQDVKRFFNTLDQVFDEMHREI